jgi:hypothetical protein
MLEVLRYIVSMSIYVKLDHEEVAHFVYVDAWVFYHLPRVGPPDPVEILIDRRRQKMDHVASYLY